MACPCRLRLLLSAFLIALGCVEIYGSTESLVFSKVERRIDLQSQAIRAVVTLKVENQGATSADSVLICFPKSHLPHIAFLKASLVEGKSKSRTVSPLTVEPTSSTSLPPLAPDDVAFLSISLTAPLAPGRTLSLEVQYTVTGLLKPFPAEILQSEPQLLLLEDSHYWLSPYPVVWQQTVLLFMSSNVESYTEKLPNRKSGNELKFGPYEDVEAFDWSNMTVHYEMSRAMPVVEKMVREIEISHWGNVYVTEDYLVKHVGAKQKKGFSRIDYQTNPGGSGVNALRGLVAILPPRAHSVYFRDEIGNVSTSNLKSDLQRTELELAPRYPLFGGWSVAFTLGYSLPLRDVVSKARDGRKVLNFTFGSPFPEVVVEECIVKIALPEGSRGVEAHAPFAVDQASEERYSYLDTFGRPVVVLKKGNVVMETGFMHFQVFYSYPQLYLLGKPLVLVAFFFALFLVGVVVVHTDLTISRHTPAYREKLQQEEIVDALQRLQKELSQQLALFERMDAVLAKLLRTGDVAGAKTARKALESELKDGSREVKSLVEQLDAAPRPPPVLPKVFALATKERDCQAAVLQMGQVLVDAFERKLSSKDIDQRVAPIQTRYAAGKSELKSLLLLLEE
eukprot:TRINITY_DN7440_c0_g1_i1.p1 TRINITY_DN7440_c0_g1~~TRINITY_DN7440_c0_g1_i1.p1  ORF type:complete len:638 (+),score=127.24 TRINITY_DN7440_c0_g1_i1:50-1915(+)